jgi:F-type H+-transporting ATPase subunit delta
VLSQEVAKKYANALFLSVKEKNLLDEAYEQFGSMKELLESDKTLLNFLSAPQVLDEHKLNVVRDVFESRLKELFVEFLIVLVDKNRVNFLPEIIDELRRMIEAEKGVGRVTVISAIALNETERKGLSVKLAKKTGLKIILEEKIDNSIIAGMIIILHNEIIDGSTKHGLDLLEDQLSKVRVH